MDVRCERCKAEYKLDDARIPAGGASVRCSACGNVFRVSKPEGGAEEGGAAAGAAARPAREWRLRQASGKVTTFKETATLQRWIVERKVTRDDELSADGASWRRLGDIPQLAPSFARADELAATGPAPGGEGPAGAPGEAATPLPDSVPPAESAAARSTLPFAAAPPEAGGLPLPPPGRTTQIYAAASPPASNVETSPWGSAAETVPPAGSAVQGGSGWETHEEDSAVRTGRQFPLAEAAQTPTPAPEEGTAFYQYDAARLASLRSAAEGGAPSGGTAREEPPAEVEVDADVEETPPGGGYGAEAYGAEAYGAGAAGAAAGQPGEGFSPFGDEGAAAAGHEAGGGFQAADFQEPEAGAEAAHGITEEGAAEAPVRRRSRWPLLALLGVGAVGAAAAAAFFLLPGEPPPPQPASPPAAAKKRRADGGTAAGAVAEAPTGAADAGVRADGGTALAQKAPAAAAAPGRDAGVTPAAPPAGAVVEAPRAAPGAGTPAGPAAGGPPAESPAVAGGVDPAMFSRWLTFGDRRLAEGDTARALRSYDRAAVIDPASPEPYVRRGRAQLKAGNAQGALPEFEKALQKDANAGGALFGVGQAHEALGDQDAARKAYRRYLQVLPKGPQAAAARERLSELGGTQ